MKKKLIIGTLLFSLLIICSEIIYLMNNRPKYLFDIYVIQFQRGIEQKNSKKVLWYLDRLANWRIGELEELGLLSQDTYKIKSPEIDDQTALAMYENLLVNINVETLKNRYYNEIARLYYQLGLLSYQNGDLSNAEDFFVAATYTSPEWSYFHIELANLYLSKGDINEARERLDFCILFDRSKEDCKSFLDDYIESQEYYEVGYFSDLINEI